MGEVDESLEVTRMVRALRRPVAGPESDGLNVSSLKRAAALLRESRMPADEIRTIVTTEEPELVRRHLELHIERLEEWLAAQRRNLASVEELLVACVSSSFDRNPAA